MRKLARVILWGIALWVMTETLFGVKRWECENLPKWFRSCACDDTCTGREAEGM